MSTLFQKRSAQLLLLVTILLSAACSSGGDDEEDGDGSSPDFQFDACDAIGAKLINGEQCSPGSTVSVARVRIATRSGEDVLCTGTVISSNAVLTAGHCLVGLDISAIGIDVGLQSRSATQAFVHPQYQESVQLGAVFNDVAVIIANGSLNVPAVPILLSRSAEIGEEAIVTGFGTTSSGDFGDLRAGNAIVTGVSSNHIATAFNGEGSNPCTGDSGGPLLVDVDGAFVIAGVVSTGNADVEDCGPGDVTLYANLDNSGINSFVLDLVPNALVR